MGALNAERPTPDYKCGQQELYTVADTIANSYTEHQGMFISKNTNYTPTTGTDLKAGVQTARLLPDEAQRDVEHTIPLKELKKLRDECLVLWQDLTSYIRDGFAADLYDDERNAAGYGYYTGAASGDWSSVDGLMNDALTFVAANTAVLTSPGGMPAGFDTNLQTAYTDFAAKHEEYLQALESARQDTDKKIQANNKIYRELTKLCEDGKKYFRDDAAIREEFTFDSVLALVRQQQVKHNVTGLVTRMLDGTPLGQVDVLLELLKQDGSYVEVELKQTDNDGLYKFLVVDGKYRLTFAKEGYLAKVLPVVVDGGPVVVDVAMDGV